MPVSCLFLCCLITLTICIYLCERFIKAQRKQMDKLIKSLSFSLKILLYLKMIMLGLGDHVTGYYEFKNIIIVHFSINLFYVIFFILSLQNPGICIYSSHQKIQNKGIERKAHRQTSRIYELQRKQNSQQRIECLVKGLGKLTRNKLKLEAYPYTV